MEDKDWTIDEMKKLFKIRIKYLKNSIEMYESFLDDNYEENDYLCDDVFEAKWELRILKECLHIMIVGVEEKV